VSIASFFEKVLIGDKNIKKDAQNLSSFGSDEYLRGTALSDEGITGLRSSADRYGSMLDRGRALPDSVYRGYNMLRGGVADESTRSMAAVRANIANRRAQSGGFLSDEAALEYERLGDEDVRGKTFDTMRDIGVAESRDELAAVQDLYSRLDQARGMILNHGEWVSQLGYNAKVQGLLNRITRAQSITMSGNSAMTAAASYGSRG
jgi:hypothetical protein